jgi:hypothetical protein
MSSSSCQHPPVRWLDSRTPRCGLFANSPQRLSPSCRNTRLVSRKRGGHPGGISIEWEIASAGERPHRLFRDLLGPLLGSAATTGLLIRVLPRRNPRVFGQRRPRFPFATAGKALIALGVLVKLAAPRSSAMENAS